LCLFVAAAVVDGQVLCVKGQGHCGSLGGAPGDLLVKLQVGLGIAAGVLCVYVPAGVVDGQMLRVKGQGHCGRFRGSPGDLLVKLQVGSGVAAGLLCMYVPAGVLDGRVLRVKGHVKGMLTAAGLGGRQETCWSSCRWVQGMQQVGFACVCLHA
jgi:hypothetical protein